MARSSRGPAGRMDDDRLRQVVQSEIYASTGAFFGSQSGGDLSVQRRKAMEYYHGEPFGNEVEGRSSVVLTDVADVIEGMLPGLLEIFTSSDDVVRCEAVQPGDEAFAHQATEYLNHIFHKDNDGFQILYDWFKTALLQKNGIVKIWWEETDEEKRETFTGLSEDEMLWILQVEDVESIEHTPTEDGFHDLTILRKVSDGRIRIVGVPPEEFMIARRAVDIDDAPFLAHRVRRTVSELIEQGFDPDLLDTIPSYDEEEFNEERLARFEAEDDWPLEADSIDKTMRVIWVTECFLKVDYDGDGVAELRKVTIAGPGYVILDNEPIDEQPFVSITPIPTPHKFFGISVADQTMDLQLIKSTVLRQTLDNMYFVNNGRVVVNERVNLDDLLTQRPGGVVRADGKEPVSGSWEQIVTQSIGQHSYPLLEYLDSVKENRTGFSRYNQGTDADSLNKTATGIKAIQAAGAKRQELIVRVFAVGLRKLMEKELRLVINHQQRERIIRLRDEWVPMDPRSWNADMDISISVGLGHGDKQQQLLILQRIMEIQQTIVEFQGGVNGPLVGLPEIYAAFSKMIEAGGMKNTESFVTDPGQAQQQPQEKPPDPKMVEVQMKAQQAKMDAEMKGQEVQAKLAFEGMKAERDAALEQTKLAQDDKHHGEDLTFDYTELQAKTGIDDDKNRIAARKDVADDEHKKNDLAVAREKASFEADIRRDDAVLKRQDMEIRRETDMETRKERAASEKKDAKKKSNGKAEPVVVNLNIAGAAKKKISLARDSAGKITGGEVSE